jgi:hypothetical protein
MILSVADARSIARTLNAAADAAASAGQTQFDILNVLEQLDDDASKQLAAAIAAAKTGGG